MRRANRDRLLKELEFELGPSHFEQKVQNFRDIGSKPFSIVSFHNRFFEESRRAFTQGLYYPALTSSCALGERMLNHMVLSLRDAFKASVAYKKVYRKESFDDWGLAIAALAEWKVLDDKLVKLFEALKILRNKSLHFSIDTYSSVRDDSLNAIKLLAEIITLRFGFFRLEHSWAIEGTAGAQFIKKSFEHDPFIKTFYLPQCPIVGPLYAVSSLRMECFLSILRHILIIKFLMKNLPVGLIRGCRRVW